MHTQVELWTQLIANPHSSVDARAVDWIALASADEIQRLLQKSSGLAQISPQTTNVDAWRNLLEQLPAWTARLVTDTYEEQPDFTQSIDKLYIALASFEAIPSQNLLAVLTTLGGEKNLKEFSQLILKSPPKGTVEAATPFLPLFRRTVSGALRDVAEHVFPDLLPGLENPNLAPAILDLANFVTRSGQVSQHPATSRTPELITLLSGLINGLESLQFRVEERRETDTNAFRRFNDSTGLVISLADALALIGNQAAVPTLHRLLELRHRRLRVEAAAALARLGHQDGVNALAELAAEPAVRLRVLHYAAELDRTEAIDEQFREPIAVAEAELIAFLSDPTVLGVPPTSCELVDSRTQHWPGYEEPRNCYLFRYTYQTTDAAPRVISYSNIGIAGPLVHAFRNDLANLPLADIYAAFAGWQTEHDEIYLTDFPTENTKLPRELAARDLADQRIVDALLRRVADEGYKCVIPRHLGSFFGDKVLIAEATKPINHDDITLDRDVTLDETDNSDSAHTGSIIVDSKDTYWYPQHSARSVDGDLAYNIYKGRRLLRAFNDDLGD